MNDNATVLAPREIADLVYRCCRVAGLDPGTANRCAANVVHGEIHRGGSVDAFVAASAAQLHDFAAAAHEVELAEALGQSANFETPTPIASVSEALWQAANRGYCADLSDSSLASDTVTTVEFERRELSGERQTAARARTDRAMANGLAIESTTLEQLEALASAFLVAEHVVDAAS